MKGVIRIGNLAFVLAAFMFAYVLWICREITKNEK